MSFHLAHHYSLNFSEMGTGKSRMALATAAAAGFKRVTVFAPAFLKRTWEEEARTVGLEVLFTSYSAFSRKSPPVLEFTGFWIADECHALKNPRARRTQGFYEALKRFKPSYFIGLTGTPIKNRIPDLWTLFGFCNANPLDTSGRRLEGELAKFFGFCKHFCHLEEVRINGIRIPKFTGLKAEREGELKSFFKDKAIRFRVAEVLNELPPLTRKSVWVDLRTAADSELDAAFAAYLAGHKTDIRAKVLSAALKAPLTAEYVNGLLEGGSEAVLIFSDHLESARGIASRIRDAKLITGGTPMEERQNLVSKFQAGEIPALVATIGALSTGVTLSRARDVVFNDLSWTPSDNQQAEKRIHRIGQRGACVAHYVQATPTDDYIRRVLESKLETIQRVVA